MRRKHEFRDKAKKNEINISKSNLKTLMAKSLKTNNQDDGGIGRSSNNIYASGNFDANSIKLESVLHASLNKTKKITQQSALSDLSESGNKSMLSRSRVPNILRKKAPQNNLQMSTRTKSETNESDYITKKEKDNENENFVQKIIANIKKEEESPIKVKLQLKQN